MSADVSNRQFLTCLIAGNRFVLSPVVLEHAVDFLHAGAEEHVTQKDCQLEHCFQDDPRPAPHGDHFCHQPSQERRQKGKQKNCQHYTCAGGKGHQHTLYLGAGVFVQPAVQLALVLLFFLFFLFRHGNIGGVHQVFVPVHQVFHHIAHSAHQGNFIVPVGGHIGIAQINRAVRAAYRAADFFRAAHHNALHQGLAAHRGTEFFSWTLFLRHGFSFIFAVKSAHADVPARRGRWAG